MLASFYSKIRSSLEWSRALTAASSGREAEALAHVDNAQRLARRQLPQFDLLRVTVLQALQCKKRFRAAALDAVTSIASSRGLRDEDRKYLRAYLWVMCGPMIDSLTIDDKQKLQFDVSSVDLDQVSSRWRKLFALLEHPGWRSGT